MRPACKPLIALALITSLFLLTACETSVEKYRNQGIALYQQQQYDEALVNLNKALSYSQSDAKANTYAGLIQFQAGNYVQAEYHFKLALQMDPSSELAKDGIAETMIKTGDPDKALDYLERASAQADKVKDPRWEKTITGRVYQKQTEEGLYVGRAADRARIARTYEKLGDYDNAIAWYNKALQVDPGNTAILMAAASLSEKAGNKTATREYLRRAYLADPSTPGLVEAMTRNDLAISDVLPVPKPNSTIVPAPK